MTRAELAKAARQENRNLDDNPDFQEVLQKPVTKVDQEADILVRQKIEEQRMLLALKKENIPDELTYLQKSVGKDHKCAGTTLTQQSIVLAMIDSSMSRGTIWRSTLGNYIDISAMRPQCQNSRDVEHNIISKKDNTRENPGPYRVFFQMDGAKYIFW